MIKVNKHPGVYYRESTGREAPDNFSHRDFKNPSDAENFRDAILKGGFGLSLDSSQDPVLWLNSLLTVPDLYEKICSDRKARFPKEIDKMAVATAADRLKAYNELAAENQQKIKILNHLLLGFLYGAKMPQNTGGTRPKGDKCFYVSFKTGSKKVWEKVGWVSEGYSAQMAANIRAERIRSIRHGDELPKSKKAEITFGEAWQRYKEWLQTGKKRPKNDEYMYEKHLKVRFAKKSLSEIPPFDLEKLKIDLGKENLAPASVKHVLVLVRQIVNKAIAWELWSGINPVSKIKLPRLNNARERFLSPQEAKALLEELKKTSNQLYEIALLSLHTGMRAGEIFALRWGHIDIEHGLILVADPKAGVSRRAHMTPTIKDLFKSKTSGEAEQFVFRSRNGGQIREVSRAFDRVVTRLGFNNGIIDPRQKISFHSLRHTFASWLALKNNSLRTIMELLGHRTLAMTVRYSHLIPDHNKAAILGIEETLSQAEQEKNKRDT
jgi:integrase